MVTSSTNVQQDEADRLKTLLQYEILDTLPDPAFDEITRMAASICQAGYAYIGFLDAQFVLTEGDDVARRLVDRPHPALGDPHAQ